MEHNRHQTTAAVAEQLLEVGILAMKGFIFMLWVQSMASPIQFFMGGLLILLAAYLLNWYSRRSSAVDSSTAAPARSRGRKTVRFHDHGMEETPRTERQTQ